MYRNGDLTRLYHVARTTEITLNLVVLVASFAVLLAALLAHAFSRGRPIYLLSYHCTKPPEYLKATRARFIAQTKRVGFFNDRALDFQERVVAGSGLGDQTYLPEAVLSMPPQPSMATARQEACDVIFPAVERALAEAGLSPQAVDVLIVNCSLFNPTPSLSAMVVNHFKMRTNVVTYNLSGMGCSAGVIAVSLAQQVLQAMPGAVAVVVSTENITQNWYRGQDRSMLIPNCLFRVGGAAMVLSSRRRDRRRAKYELLHCVRTHMGRDDAHYRCVYQQEDEQGLCGVHLSRDLMRIAGHALKANITTLGPLVLPLSEQLLFFANLIARKALRGRKVKPYIPDFKLAVEHFCIHTGGRGVIDALEQQLELGPEHVAPSRETLRRYGNVSSSSIWYVLAQIESTQGVRRGDKVWQIAFGSGFKCNSAVWRALRDNDKVHDCWKDDDEEKSIREDTLGPLDEDKRQDMLRLANTHIIFPKTPKDAGKEDKNETGRERPKEHAHAHAHAQTVQAAA